MVAFSLGGFTTLFAATEVPELVRGVVLLNSAGQFGDPNAPPKAEEAAAEEEVSALTRLIVRPLKEAFQRVVLGFLFWQAKQPARVEKVLKSVRNSAEIHRQISDSDRRIEFSSILHLLQMRAGVQRSEQRGRVPDRSG